jgi:hypothetical protein
VYRSFLAIAGQQTTVLSDASATLADVIAEVNDIKANTPAPVVKTTGQSTTNSSGGGGDSVVTTILKSAFGLPELIGGLFGLFGGGDSPTPAPLVKYALPAAVDFQAAESQGRVTELQYNQMGLARTYSEQRTAPASGTQSQAATTAGGTGVGAAPQITVNVQAMDARSFLDRSNDIALAVRDAMLNLNAINDVVNEL